MIMDITDEAPEQFPAQERLDLHSPAFLLVRCYGRLVTGPRYSAGVEVYDRRGNWDVLHLMDEGIGSDFLVKNYGDWALGWRVIENITVEFSKDFNGEVDESWDFTSRRATLPEILSRSIGYTWKELLDDIKEALLPGLMKGY